MTTVEKDLLRAILEGVGPACRDAIIGGEVNEDTNELVMPDHCRQEIEEVKVAYLHAEDLGGAAVPLSNAVADTWLWSAEGRSYLAFLVLVILAVSAFAYSHFGRASPTTSLRLRRRAAGSKKSKKKEKRK